MIVEFRDVLRGDSPALPDRGVFHLDARRDSASRYACYSWTKDGGFSASADTDAYLAILVPNDYEPVTSQVRRQLLGLWRNSAQHAPEPD